MIFEILVEVKDIVYVQINKDLRKVEVLCEEIERHGYTNFLKFEGFNSTCDKLTGIMKGSKIKISFYIRGKQYLKGEKEMYFTTLVIHDITVIGFGEESYVVTKVLEEKGKDELPF